MVPLEEREPFSKMAPKQPPKGVIFKKRFETVPFHQKGHHFGSLWEPFFLKKRLEMAPLGQQIVQPVCNLFRKTALFSLKWHYFGAPVAVFLYRKCMGKQLPFRK